MHASPAESLNLTAARRVAPRRGLAWPAVLLAVGLALAAGPCRAENAPNTAEVKQQQASLDKIRDRIQSLNKSLEQDRERQDQLGRDLQSTENAISKLASYLGKLDSQVNRQLQAVEETRNRRAGVAEKMDAERGALRTQVRAAYQMGREQQTKLLLNQEDPARLGRVLTYYDYLNRSRIRQIQLIQDQLQQLQDLENRLRAQLDDLLKLQNERKQALENLKTTRDLRRTTLNKIGSRITDHKREIADLRRSESRLTQLLSSMQQALADAPLDLGSDRPFPRLKGRLPWPARGKLLASFGQPKAGGRLAWNGIWIASPTGTPVRVIAKGRVVYVGALHHYGLIVVVEHGSNYFSLYGHNQSASVSVGQTLDMGQTVATAGDSGGHEQSGVYLEIRKGQDPVNPLLWLRR
jgi:septal ring factor EnvC (AmiA/AmiB activator)